MLVAWFQRALLIICVCVVSNGCTLRETHSPRTSTEQFLLAQAAERAVFEFEEAFPLLYGKRVFVDGRFLDGIDRDYVFSSLRHYLNMNGAILVGQEAKKTVMPDGTTKMLGPDFVVELRRGALGLKEGNLGLGVPLIPVPVPSTSLSSFTQPLFLFNRKKSEGWAKFQAWIYEADSHQYVLQTDDLWGHTYYVEWWFFLIGPFDFSQDIYIDEDNLPEKDTVSKDDPKPVSVKETPIDKSKESR